MGHNCMGSFKHWALCPLDIRRDINLLGQKAKNKNNGICNIWDI
jgi:hypothetical protein